MPTIHAIYENGVFKPTEPLPPGALPERCEVYFEPRQVAEEDIAENENRPVNLSPEGMEKIHALLLQGGETGITDLAARHNELDP